MQIYVSSRYHIVAAVEIKKDGEKVKKASVDNMCLSAVVNRKPNFVAGRQKTTWVDVVKKKWKVPIKI